MEEYFDLVNYQGRIDFYNLVLNENPKTTISGSFIYLKTGETFTVTNGRCQRGNINSIQAIPPPFFSSFLNDYWTGIGVGRSKSIAPFGPSVMFRNLSSLSPHPVR